MSYRVGFGVVLVMAALAAACGGPATTSSSDPTNSPAGSVTVESCGQSLSFARPPERVVTLDQSSTETMLALGLQDRLVGTSNLKTKVAAEYQAAYRKVPVLSSEVLTGEQLRAAGPDLVVASFTDLFTRDRVGTREELAELDVPSFVSAVDCPQDNAPGKTSFDRLFTDYQHLGRIFGVQQRAAMLASQQQKALRQAAEVEPAGAGRPSVLWLYSIFKGLPYVAGEGGMPSEMSRLVGVENAFDDVPEDWPEVSWEEIAKRNPDFIVIGDLSERGAPGDSAEEKLDEMRKHPTVSKLSAVRENRIITVPGIEMDPSVRSVHTLGLLVEGMRELGYAR